MAPALRPLLLAAVTSGLSACLVPVYECSGVAEPDANRYANPIWRSFGGTPSRDGRSSLVGPQSAKYATFFDIGIFKCDPEGCHGALFWPLVGADNTVYVSSDERVLYAVDGTSGKVRWAFPGSGYFAPALGPNGTLYVANARNEIVALDPASGNPCWVAYPGRVSSGINVAPDGTVLFATSEPGQLHALDGRTGEEKWQHANISLGEPPTIGEDGTVYVQESQRVYALDGATGALKWSTGTDDDLFAAGASPAFADGRLYVGGGQPYDPTEQDRDILVFAFDAQTGATLWSVPVDSEMRGTPVVGPDGTVYFGTDDGLYALDGKTGASKWTLRKQGFAYNRLTFAVGADGTLYVVDRRGMIYGLDGQTGEGRWGVGAHGGAGPAIGAGGTVYVGGHGGIYAIPPNASMLSGGGPLPEGPFK